MKRRNLILGFVIIALLLVGIGYAALSKNLVVNGTLSSDATNIELNVHFDGKSLDGDVPTSASYEGTSATIGAEGFKTVGQTGVVKLKITNSTEGDIAVSLKDPVVSYGEAVEIELADGTKATAKVEDYFEVTAVLESNSLGVADEAGEDDSTYLTVTIKLVKTPVAAINGAKFTVTFTANAVQ